MARHPGRETHRAGERAPGPESRKVSGRPLSCAARQSQWHDRHRYTQRGQSEPGWSWRSCQARRAMPHLDVEVLFRVQESEQREGGLADFLVRYRAGIARQFLIAPQRLHCEGLYVSGPAEPRMLSFQEIKGVFAHTSGPACFRPPGKVRDGRAGSVCAFAAGSREGKRAPPHVYWRMIYHGCRCNFQDRESLRRV